LYVAAFNTSIGFIPASANNSISWYKLQSGRICRFVKSVPVESSTRALELCPITAPALRARIQARRGTAFYALPSESNDSLVQARDCFEEALKTLRTAGTTEESAEVEMNLGLVLQSLSQSGQAKIQDAIQSYHRALRTFTRERCPQEFAILHNNLAIAYLSIPMSDERARMREALAVQSFEEVLKVINLIDHPSEYAMIQNNLGNALQYAASGHPLENNLRALEAYEEALKVRTRRDTPLEYANTIANKANVLRNMPDDPGREKENLGRARDLYREAEELFRQFGQAGNADLVAEAAVEIERELEIAGVGV
jgi:tetratricopeptide (TPR) repeat protein